MRVPVRVRRPVQLAAKGAEVLIYGESIWYQACTLPAVLHVLLNHIYRLSEDAHATPEHWYMIDTSGHVYL